jgi:hypothetical protein
VKNRLVAVENEHAELRKLTLRVAEGIMKADEYQTLPADLMKAADLRKYLAVDAASFGLDDEDDDKPIN